MNYPPKYTGHYLGIVVQNNDPAKRGRAKVFVPHISPTVYKKWNEISKDKKFKFIGANVCSDLTEILDDLKRILPWAELAAPLAGESASGRYNAYLNSSTISDSYDVTSAYTNLSSCEPDPKQLDENSQNVDNVGEKPGNIYDVSMYRLKDAFADPAVINANSANVYSFNYTPECYSNCAKGAFPILRVGAHVWVFFNDGDPLKPVIFASSFGSEDWRGIHDIVEEGDKNEPADEGIDYPGAYENVSQQENSTRDINVDTYRNKYVINQKGGTLAFVNTDNKEVLKLIHFSGSFKEFNNFCNIELATSNDQKLVLKDQFLTVRGSRNEFTQFDYDNIVQGDYFRKIGLLDKDIHQAWKDKVSLVDQIKSLFNIQRATGSSGGLEPCPVCNKNAEKNWWMNSSYNKNYNPYQRSSMSTSAGNSIWGTVFTEKGLQKSVEPGPKGQPILVSPTDSLGGSADGSTGFNAPGYIGGIKCKACGGTGVSPSSQGGSFPAEERKNQIPDLIKGKIGELTELERRMGLGGSEFVEIAKNRVETVGLVMNDFTPIRVDPKGKMVLSEISIGDYGTYKDRTPTPYIERVQVDDLPGGTYTLNVCNKYNVMVGAGGLNLKSYGVVHISGAMTNISGMQINIGSEHEINIDGGRRCNITADVLRIRQREGKQVVVDGSLGIAGNSVVHGGLHVDGELTATHLTVPMQTMDTAETKVFAAPNTDVQNKNGFIIGFGVPMSNYATVNNAEKKSFKENSPKDTGEPYLGFTDATKVVGRLKKETNIGYIGSSDPGEASATIGYLPVGTQITVSGIPTAGAPVTLTLTAPVAIKSSYTGTAPGVVSVIASSTGEEGGQDTPVYGSGPGDDADLEEGTVRACIKGSDAGSGGVDAQKMPIVIYGTGADTDAILCYPHSHTYKTIAFKGMNTQIDVRKRAQASGYAQNPADPPVDAPQGANGDDSTGFLDETEGGED